MCGAVLTANGRERPDGPVGLTEGEAATSLTLLCEDARDPPPPHPTPHGPAGGGSPLPPHQQAGEARSRRKREPTKKEGFLNSDTAPSLLFTPNPRPTGSFGTIFPAKRKLAYQLMGSMYLTGHFFKPPFKYLLHPVV